MTRALGVTICWFSMTYWQISHLPSVLASTWAAWLAFSPQSQTFQWVFSSEAQPAPKLCSWGGRGTSASQTSHLPSTSSSAWAASLAFSPHSQTFQWLFSSETHSVPKLCSWGVGGGRGTSAEQTSHLPSTSASAWAASLAFSPHSQTFQWLVSSDTHSVPKLCSWEGIGTLAEQMSHLPSTSASVWAAELDFSPQAHSFQWLSALDFHSVPKLWVCAVGAVVVGAVVGSSPPQALSIAAMESSIAKLVRTAINFFIVLFLSNVIRMSILYTLGTQLSMFIIL